MTQRRTFAEAMERAIYRSKATKLMVAANAGAGLLAFASSPVIQGCGAQNENNVDESQAEEESFDESKYLGDGKADWAQDQGKKDTTKVQYRGDWWKKDTNCNTRIGCTGAEVGLKIFVQPTENADLSKKEVGVVYHQPGSSGTTTVKGEYRGQADNGMEEWNVIVSISGGYQQPGAFAFSAYYKDGAGTTYVDDNAGEYHVVGWKSVSAVITNDSMYSSGTERAPILDDNGLSGRILIDILDLDYHKDVVLVGTLDNWQSEPIVFGTGAEHVNNWHWVQNTYSGHQQWELILDYKGDFQQFEYAIVYKHGVKNGAKVYEFWANNGGNNFTVRKNAHLGRH